MKSIQFIGPWTQEDALKFLLRVAELAHETKQQRPSNVVSITAKRLKR